LDKGDKSRDGSLKESPSKVVQLERGGAKEGQGLNRDASREGNKRTVRDKEVDQGEGSRGTLYQVIEHKGSAKGQPT